MRYLKPKRRKLRLLRMAFTCLARLHWPVPAALLLRATTRSRGRGPGHRSVQAYRILMLPRDVFSEDVFDSLGKSDRFRILSVWKFAFKSMAWGILPPKLCDTNYLSDDPVLENAKARYRAFLTKLWATYSRLVQVDGVVTGNYGYYAERELAAVLENCGVPFIAMHKENLKTPGLESFYEDLYRSRRGPFTGRRILTYNEIERGVECRAGVVAPDRVTVCGMPRLDRIHAWRRSHAGDEASSRDARRVLVFGFTDKIGLPQLPRKRRAGFAEKFQSLGQDLDSLAWTVLFRETHRAIVEFALEHPEVEVIIKTKQGKRYASPSADYVNAGAGQCTNLRLVRGGDPFALIVSADVVVGFNTTSLLEAIAAGKPVVVPWFAEAVAERTAPYAVDLGDAVELATSPADLVARLGHHVAATSSVPCDLSPQRVGALEHWCGNVDGKAGERVCRAVELEMSRRLDQSQPLSDPRRV